MHTPGHDRVTTIAGAVAGGSFFITGTDDLMTALGELTVAAGSGSWPIVGLAAVKVIAGLGIIVLGYYTNKTQQTVLTTVEDTTPHPRPAQEGPGGHP